MSHRDGPRGLCRSQCEALGGTLSRERKGCREEIFSCCGNGLTVGWLAMGKAGAKIEETAKSTDPSLNETSSLVPRAFSRARAGASLLFNNTFWGQ